MAAGGDGRYLVCVAGAAAIVSMRNRFSLGVPQHVVVQCCSCVRSSVRFLNVHVAADGSAVAA